MPVIETVSLTKSFARQRRIRHAVAHPLRWPEPIRALVDVSLAVETGELFALVGPNGAGKTTLLKILCTLILPTSGTARVGGVAVSEDGESIRRRVGLVTGEERSFYWRLTGRQNLLFFAALHDLDRRQAQRRTEELLELVGISAGDRDRMVQEYSTGTKRRLAIARALLHDPEILLLDEPTASLDPLAAEGLRDFVRGELRDRSGKTILFTTHRLEEAEGLSSRMAVLAGGRLRACGSASDIVRKSGAANLMEAYRKLAGGGRESFGEVRRHGEMP